MRGRVKFVWWFIGQAALLDEETGLPVADEGTQMADENYESFFLDLDINVHREKELNAAVGVLASRKHRDTVKEAIRLVCDTYPEWFPKATADSADEEEDIDAVENDE